MDNFTLQVVRKQDVNPGDIILVVYPDGTTDEYAEQILAVVEDSFKGFGVDILGTFESVRLEVISKAKA